MAEIVTLKDSDNTALYPQTKYNAVLDANGESLPSDFTDIVEYDATGASSLEQSFLNNYYTKSQVYSKDEIDNRYIYSGELTSNKTYTFGETTSVNLYLNGSGSTTSVTGTTHGRPIIVAGKVFATFTNMYNAMLYFVVDSTEYQLLNTNDTASNNFAFFRVITLSSGSHTFRFRIKGNNPSNNQTLNVTQYDTSDYTICEL